ncbi:MAG: hypothetical protein GF364_13135 [Candidatus Lokiarchaeota archaeon]|nr:hypothetical protein [Candidatus Lokiarchaeota archaeon]
MQKSESLYEEKGEIKESADYQNYALPYTVKYGDMIFKYLIEMQFIMLIVTAPKRFQEYLKRKSKLYKLIEEEETEEHITLKFRLNKKLMHRIKNLNHKKMDETNLVSLVNYFFETSIWSMNVFNRSFLTEIPTNSAQNSRKKPIELFPKYSVPHYTINAHTIEPLNYKIYDSEIKNATPASKLHSNNECCLVGKYWYEKDIYGVRINDSDRLKLLESSKQSENNSSENSELPEHYSVIFVEINNKEILEGVKIRKNQYMKIDGEIVEDNSKLIKQSSIYRIMNQSVRSTSFNEYRSEIGQQIELKKFNNVQNMHNILNNTEEIVISKKRTLKNSEIFSEDNPIIDLIIFACPHLLFFRKPRRIYLDDLLISLKRFYYHIFEQILSLELYNNIITIDWLSNVILDKDIDKIIKDTVFMSSSQQDPYILLKNTFDILSLLNHNIIPRNFEIPKQVRNQLFERQMKVILRGMLDEFYHIKNNKYVMNNTTRFFDVLLLFLVRRDIFIAQNSFVADLMLTKMHRPTFNRRSLQEIRYLIDWCYLGINTAAAMNFYYAPKWIKVKMNHKRLYEKFRVFKPELAKWCRNNVLSKQRESFQLPGKYSGRSVTLKAKHIPVKIQVDNHHKSRDMLIEGEALSMVEKFPYCVIIGDPGTGKTFITYQLLQKKFGMDYEPIQIRIDLALLHSNSTEELEDDFKKCLFDINDIGIDNAQLLYQIGAITVILDAANEINKEIRPHIYKMIREFTNIFPLVDVVVTTRTAHFNNELNWPKLKLVPLSNEQILDYASVELSEVHTGLAKSFKSWLKNNKFGGKFLEMFRVPYFLRIGLEHYKKKCAQLDIKSEILTDDQEKEVFRTREIFESYIKDVSLRNILSVYDVKDMDQLYDILREVAYYVVDKKKNETAIAEMKAISIIGGNYLKNLPEYKDVSVAELIEKVEALINQKNVIKDLKFDRTMLEEGLERFTLTTEQQSILDRVFDIYDLLLESSIIYVNANQNSTPDRNSKAYNGRELYGCRDRYVRFQHQSLQEFLASRQFYNIYSGLDVKEKQEFLELKVRSKVWEEVIWQIFIFTPEDDKFISDLLYTLLNANMKLIGQYLRSASGEIKGAQVIEKVTDILIGIVENTNEINRIRTESLRTLLAINNAKSRTFIEKLMNEQLSESKMQGLYHRPTFVNLKLSKNYLDPNIEVYSCLLSMVINTHLDYKKADLIYLDEYISIIEWCIEYCSYNTEYVAAVKTLINNLDEEDLKEEFYQRLRDQLVYRWLERGNMHQDNTIELTKYLMNKGIKFPKDKMLEIFNTSSKIQPLWDLVSRTGKEKSEFFEILINRIVQYPSRHITWENKFIKYIDKHLPATKRVANALYNVWSQSKGYTPYEKTLEHFGHLIMDKLINSQIINSGRFYKTALNYVQNLPKDDRDNLLDDINGIPQRILRHSGLADAYDDFNHLLRIFLDMKIDYSELSEDTRNFMIRKCKSHIRNCKNGSIGFNSHYKRYTAHPAFKLLKQVFVSLEDLFDFTDIKVYRSDITKWIIVVNEIFKKIKNEQTYSLDTLTDKLNHLISNIDKDCSNDIREFIIDVISQKVLPESKVPKTNVYKWTQIIDQIDGTTKEMKQLITWLLICTDNSKIGEKADDYLENKLKLEGQRFNIKNISFTNQLIFLIAYHYNQELSWLNKRIDQVLKSYYAESDLSNMLGDIAYYYWPKDSDLLAKFSILLRKTSVIFGNSYDNIIIDSILGYGYNRSNLNNAIKYIIDMNNHSLFSDFLGFVSGFTNIWLSPNLNEDQEKKAVELFKVALRKNRTSFYGTKKYLRFINITNYGQYNIEDFKGVWNNMGSASDYIEKVLKCILNEPKNKAAMIKDQNNETLNRIIRKCKNNSKAILDCLRYIEERYSFSEIIEFIQQPILLDCIPSTRSRYTQKYVDRVYSLLLKLPISLVIDNMDMFRQYISKYQSKRVRGIWFNIIRLLEKHLGVSLFSKSL